jgi:hypothetical protein
MDGIMTGAYYQSHLAWALPILRAHGIDPQWRAAFASESLLEGLVVLAGLRR